MIGSTFLDALLMICTAVVGLIGITIVAMVFLLTRIAKKRSEHAGTSAT